jgi:hypothetical protein
MENRTNTRRYCRELVQSVSARKSANDEAEPGGFMNYGSERTQILPSFHWTSLLARGRDLDALLGGQPADFQSPERVISCPLLVHQDSLQTARATIANKI